MDASQEEKQSYIQEKLISKGYDSFLFTQFLCKKAEQSDFDLNKFSMGEIREGIQEFIHSTPLGKSTDSSAPPLIQKPERKGKDIKKNIVQSFFGLKMNKSEVKKINNSENSEDNEKIKEEKNYDYGFRLPDKLKCQNVEETEISQYDDLPIKIGFPEKVDKGFLKKTVTYFTTIAVPLGKVVKRSFEDFEWLRQKLIKMFDSNFIPSLPKLNPILGIENDEATTRDIEKFMQYLSLDPIIKNSQILYDFLSIENYDQFVKKKKEYEFITPCNDIQEFKSITGEIDINFDEEKEKKLKTIKDFCINNSKLLDKLTSSLYMFYQEMNNVIRRANEIANIWGNLYKTSEKFNDDAISKEIYFQMNNFFFNLAKNYKKQNEFINIDIKESFSFMQNNYGSINDLIKRIENKQKVYFKEEKELISLKEDLFKTRNTPGHKIHNSNIDVSKKNDIGEFDLSTLLPINTQALLDMKKSYGFYLNRFLKEYERMKKLNSIIYKEKIQRCYKNTNFIASELCACVENLMSSMDVYSGGTPTGNEFEKPKEKIIKNNNDKKNENMINENKINENEKKVNKNENQINEDKNNNKINEDKNENKINENKNENKINENKNENKINEDKNVNKINENKNENNINDKVYNINSIEDSGFNIIKDNDEKK